jgi:hypothetical protein
MKVYTVIYSDLQTRHGASLSADLVTDLDEARAAFLANIGDMFDTWEEFIAFAERWNRWDGPQDTYFAHLTEDDKKRCPLWNEGCPMEVHVTEDGALWVDGTLDGISVALEVHEI